MSNPPDISVIIPAFNRGPLIRHCLESVRRATGALAVETIVVDDGSAPPVSEDLSRLDLRVTTLIRQPNRGLLFARLAGLPAARGRYVLFLDSDDLVAADKLRRQVADLDASGADVGYTDVAHAELRENFDAIVPVPQDPLPTTTSGAEFFIRLQPAPHSPLFRAGFLHRVVNEAFIPPSPLYNSVAEIWFYHNAAPLGARVVRTAGAHAIVGLHPGPRLTNRWERLAVASLAVMEAFVRHCPTGPATTDARRLVAEKAFQSWRALPRDFHPDFDSRLLNVWRRLGAPPDLERLGGRGFQQLARWIGPTKAGRLYRRFRNAPHTASGTMSPADVAALLAVLPPP